MGDLLQPTHLVILAVLAFLLFGARRLPELGKGLGEGLRGFKDGLGGGTQSGNAPAQVATVVASAPPAQEPVAK